MKKKKPSKESIPKTTKNDKKLRKYPLLSDQQEKAIILRANNHTYAQIGEVLNKSESTVRDWFQTPEMKEALEKENLEIISESRDSFGVLVKSSYEKVKSVVENTFEDERAEIASGNLALSVLEKSGYLPKSSTQESKEKTINEILQRLETALNN